MKSPSKVEDEPSLALGGQALIEGIMIRSRKHMVMCVRQPNKEILIKTEVINLVSENHSVLRWPFLRGVVALAETLYLGVKGIYFSANTALGEDEAFTYKEIAVTVVAFLALTSFFIVVPFLIATFFNLTGSIFNIIEALVRLSFFLLYLTLVSLWGEFKRILQYHGAEHKAINAYEAGVEMNVENVKKFSRLHPRCGTSFLLIVIIISIFLFSIMPSQEFVMRLSYRVLLIPVIGAMSYEILKLSDKYRRSNIMRLLVLPGLGFQRLTTREPDDDMLSVALKAVEEASKLEQKP